MIDNFELIKGLLKDERDYETFYHAQIVQMANVEWTGDQNKDSNVFYHAQIVKRAKDHKPINVKESEIHTYLIRDQKHLEDVMDEIRMLCELYGARAYINVSPKSFDGLQRDMLMQLAKNLTENITQDPRKVLNSCAGSLKSKFPKFLIDIDDVSQCDAIKEWLRTYYKDRFNLDGDGIYATIPTKNGLHFIVEPFNRDLFGKAFPNVDVHKNSMGTLLYYPDSLDNKS